MSTENTQPLRSQSFSSGGRAEPARGGSPARAGNDAGPVRGVGPSELRVEVLSGNRAGEERAFKGPEVLIGRRPRNHIVFDGPDDRIVSGLHLRFEARADGWWVEDRGSTNGTTLNGKQLERPTRVEAGSQLELGRRRAGEGAKSVVIRVTRAAVGQGADDSANDSGDEGAGLAHGPRTVLYKEQVGVLGVPEGGQHEPEDFHLDIPRPEVARRGAKDTQNDIETARIKADPLLEAPRAEHDPIVIVRPSAVRSASGELNRPGAAPPSNKSGQAAQQGKEVEIAKTDPLPKSAKSSFTSLSKRERVRLLKEKSRLHGQVEYRLGSHVERLVEACLEGRAEREGQKGGGGRVTIELEPLTGGPELLEQLATKAQLEREVAAVEVDLPERLATLRAQRAPIMEEERLGAQKRRLAEAAVESALTHAQKLRTRRDAAAETTRVALREALAPVTRALEPRAPAEGPSASSGQSAAGDWSALGAALDASRAALKERAPELDSLQSTTDEAEAIATRLASEAQVATREHAGAASRAAELAAQIETEESEGLTRLSAARTELAWALDAVETRAKELVQAQLGQAESALEVLPEFHQARLLWRESEALQRDLEELEKSLD